MKNSIKLIAASLLACGLTACGGSSGTTPTPVVVTPPPPPPPTTFGEGPAVCAAGKADGFDCNGVDLQKHVTLAALGATAGNDSWGWVDPVDGTEYALMGLDNGTAFVRLTDPQNPVIAGTLPTQSVAAAWRDIKVYQNHAYIVADNAGAHGIQVFDLTRLRGSTTNQTFAADTVYNGIENAHNIVINEDSGFAYAVGTNTCGEGLHMVDISTPLNPTFAGCHFVGDTHDAQCVNYMGPDADYAGAEICFSSDGSSVGISDVSNKGAPVTLSQSIYPNLGFVHQAWVDDSHTYLVVNDELDERDFGQATSTIVLDISDLDNPIHLYTHGGTTNSIDHNLYIIGTRIFESNYTSGLQILDFTDLATDTFVETAFFDSHPDNDGTTFNGAWNVYPFLPSGNLIISDIDRGLFIVKPQ
jgi:choice-of-anchor B domain-containing protein